MNGSKRTYLLRKHTLLYYKYISEYALDERDTWLFAWIHRGDIYKKTLNLAIYNRRRAQRKMPRT